MLQEKSSKIVLKPLSQSCYLGPTDNTRTKETHEMPEGLRAQQEIQVHNEEWGSGLAHTPAVAQFSLLLLYRVHIHMHKNNIALKTLL